MSEERKQQILEVLTRQMGGKTGSIDPVALAAEIDAALGGDALEAGPNPTGRRAPIKGPPGAGSSPKGAYMRADEGKSPDQLNASNDDGEG